MRIAVIGAGNMAAALGAQWARAGHELVVAGRTPERARELARRIGAEPAELHDVAAFGEALLVAVPHAGVLDTLIAAGAGGGALAGRTLIDCTNPIVSMQGLQLVTAEGPSIAGRIAAITGANVVKAFNLCHFEIYAMMPPVFAGVPLGIPLCGDDAGARAAVAGLIAEMGATPLDVGGLDRAARLEAVAATVIELVMQGADPRVMLPPVRHELPGQHVLA